MTYYSATYYKSANNTPEGIKLEISKNGLVLHFNNGATEVWPFSDCFAGQIGQGEAECIANNRDTDIRIFTRSDIITAVNAAIKGEPFKKPGKRLFPWGAALFFGFLALCGLVWFFAG